ncbi:hypothetical protein ACNQFN_13630 [Thauera butanivorans]|uniref:hypothetical protein n=1 Tax=Thauera butanivorans TaxID=86174 RepID=UPI003AB71282
MPTLPTSPVVPDSEHWLHSAAAAAGLREALAWAQSHPASDEAADSLLQHLRDKQG